MWTTRVDETRVGMLVTGHIARSISHSSYSYSAICHQLDTTGNGSILKNHIWVSSSLLSASLLSLNLWKAKDKQNNPPKPEDWDVICRFSLDVDTLRPTFINAGAKKSVEEAKQSGRSSHLCETRSYIFLSVLHRYQLSPDQDKQDPVKIRRTDISTMRTSPNALKHKMFTLRL